MILTSFLLPLTLVFATAAQPATEPAAFAAQAESATSMVPPPDTRPFVALTTDAGTIVLRLEDKRAPISTGNFLRYVDSKRMDGFQFYRTTRNWGPSSQLVQAGNRGDARRNYPPIAHEATTTTGLTNCNGAVSMARLRPGDATSDFFLVLSDIPGFDADPTVSGDNAGFAVFGEIVSGRDVAMKIFEGPVSATDGDGVMKGQILDPKVTIKSARRIPAPEPATGEATFAGCIVKNR